MRVTIGSDFCYFIRRVILQKNVGIGDIGGGAMPLTAKN